MRRMLSVSLVFVAILSACGNVNVSIEQQQSDFKIAYMYEKGIGVPKDMTEAIKWYRKTAEEGLSEAQYNLGVLLYDGIGVAENKKEAVQWFLKAAMQGLPQAQFNVANAYREGIGIARDYPSALMWYERSAMQGFTPAEFNLGAMYGNGEGTPQNYAEAYKWLLLSSKMGYAPAAKYKEHFGPSLSPVSRKQVEEIVNAMMSDMPKQLVPGSGTITPKGMEAKTK